uniref:glycogenin glucosyltransferase n=1 Tax=Lutzomyia longipalpis TaxID=7200 RepID=A0A7G3ANT1_LUTLO
MSKFAWVTLATNDSYSLGALVVAASLRRVATAHQIAVLITPGVSEAMRTKLSTVFDVVKEVNVLDSRDSANLALLARPELGVTFTKLHCWNLTQFEKCVFLDADTLVLQNCDELFEREELSAAPDVGWPDCFNSGVFVFRPSQDTFGKLLEFAVKAGSFDGGDQGLLNLYFSDWAHSDISKHLPFVYNTCSTATYSYLPAFKQYGQGVKIIHFIGTSKPWLQNFDPQTRTVRTPDNYTHLASHLQTWWTIFFDQIHPHLSGDMNQQKEATPWYEEPQHVPPCPPPQNPSHEIFIPNSMVEVPNENLPGETHQIHFYDPWEDYEKKKSEECQEVVAQVLENHQDDVERFQEVQRIQEEVYRIHEEVETFHESHNQTPHEAPHQRCEMRQENSLEPLDSRKEAPVVRETREIDPGPEIISERFPERQENSGNQWEYHNHIENLPKDPPNRHEKIPESPQIPPEFQPEVYEEVQRDVPSEIPSELPHEHTKELPNPPAHRDPPPDQLTAQKCPQESPMSPERQVMSISVSRLFAFFGGAETGIAGALASVTLGEKRSPEQEAMESQMRRQCWESGNIDYMGRDSFENILKRINQTMGLAQPEEQQPPKEEEGAKAQEEGNQ